MDSISSDLAFLLDFGSLQMLLAQNFSICKEFSNVIPSHLGEDTDHDIWLIGAFTFVQKLLPGCCANIGFLNAAWLDNSQMYAKLLSLAVASTFVPGYQAALFTYVLCSSAICGMQGILRSMMITSEEPLVTMTICFSSCQFQKV